ncbi:hypothetical protein VNO80_08888 [Phaseolus coccineus]|uniref:Uncharacterized protein n=1 Tax=Phaseolus coccineus TaxID=3886 RepID=A0AAN9N560_PHACN
MRVDLCLSALVLQVDKLLDVGNRLIHHGVPFHCLYCSMVSLFTVFIAAFITFIGCLHYRQLAAVLSAVSPLIKRKHC